MNGPQCMYRVEVTWYASDALRTIIGLYSIHVFECRKQLLHGVTHSHTHTNTVASDVHPKLAVIQ